MGKKGIGYLRAAVLDTPVLRDLADKYGPWTVFWAGLNACGYPPVWCTTPTEVYRTEYFLKTELLR